MNESPLREVNRRINDFARSFDDSAALYVCECGEMSCSLPRIRLAQIDAADMLAMPDTLLVIAGHEPPDADVVLRRDGHTLVRRAT
jgi:hypothetical protein